MKISGLKFSYEAGPRGIQADIGRGMQGQNVLDIDELEIPDEGCLALLGPNGCGKTTLLKLIAGLLVPECGSIRGCGDAVMVHQHPYLLSGSVFSNIAYGLRIRKTPRAEIHKRVDAELERWGLSELKGRHAARLSGGERQRTAIARAMVLKPRLLLLDEPTASVDPENISQMENLINEIIETGTGVLLSTHHVDFAYRNADSIIRLKRGRLADNDQNLVTGRVTGSDESFNFFEAGGTLLYCPGREGDFRRAVFSVNDVILSREAIKSSARNVIESVVTGITEENGLSMINLKAGFSFRARVSNASVSELKLRPGEKIFALLKASSIGLY